MVLCKGLQVLVGGGSHLREPVVNLVGDPAPLLLLGDENLADQLLQPLRGIGELAVEPGVLERARRLGSQTLKDLHDIVLCQRLGTVNLEHPDGALAYPQGQEQPDDGLVLPVPSSAHREGSGRFVLEDGLLSLSDLRRIADPRFEVLQADRSPDTELPGLAQGYYSRRQPGDAAHDLQEAGGYLLPLPPPAPKVPPLLQRP